MSDTFNVTFSDIPEAIAFGNDLIQAFKRASEVLGLVLYNTNTLPTPSTIE